MVQVDPLADALNSILNAERTGKKKYLLNPRVN